MTDHLDRLAERLAKKVSIAPLSAGTIRVDIPRHGSLFVAGYGVSAARSRPDCTVTIGLDVIQSILDGREDPISALVFDRISYTGELAVARAFADILIRPQAG